MSVFQARLSAMTVLSPTEDQKIAGTHTVAESTFYTRWANIIKLGRDFTFPSPLPFQFIVNLLSGTVAVGSNTWSPSKLKSRIFLIWVWLPVMYGHQPTANCSVSC